jgi:hypothetical protein
MELFVSQFVGIDLRLLTDCSLEPIVIFTRFDWSEVKYWTLNTHWGPGFHHSSMFRKWTELWITQKIQTGSFRFANSDIEQNYNLVIKYSQFLFHFNPHHAILDNKYRHCLSVWNDISLSGAVINDRHHISTWRMSSMKEMMYLGCQSSQKPENQQTIDNDLYPIQISFRWMVVPIELFHEEETQFSKESSLMDSKILSL